MCVCLLLMSQAGLRTAWASPRVLAEVVADVEAAVVVAAVLKVDELHAPGRPVLRGWWCR